MIVISSFEAQRRTQAEVLTNGSGSDTLLNVEHLNGSNFNDVLTGNAAANTLNGRAGEDTLVGGLGNYSYYVDNIGDVVTESSVLLTEIDTLNSVITYTLGANIENLVLIGAAAINGADNALNNILTGNASDNLLSCGAGIDILIGGAGKDTLTGGLGNDNFDFNTYSEMGLGLIRSYKRHYHRFRSWSG